MNIERKLEISKMNVIKEIEREQLKSDIPEFGPGDTVAVQVRVREGQRERLQTYEGVVIAVCIQHSRFVRFLMVKVLNVFSKHIAL